MAHDAAPTAQGRMRRSVSGRRMSLQARLMLTVFTIVAGILLVVSIVTGVVLNSLLSQQLDDRLQSTAALIEDRSRAPEQPGRSAEALLAAGGVVLVEIAPSGQTSGVVVEDFRADVLTPRQVSQLIAGAQHDALTTITVPTLGTYRLMTVDDDSGYTRVVGVSTVHESRTLTRMLWSIALTTMGGMLVLGVATTGVIGRGLRPLRAIAATATRVSRQRLDQGDVSIPERVPEDQSDVDTEIGQVGDALNVLLDHVEDSLAARQRNEETMRRFVADASHELRTPLASIRGYSELTQRDGTLSETSRQSLERIEAQSQRMTGLVEDLLLLARLDEGTELTVSAVDLREVALEAVADQAMAGMDHDWGAEVGEEPVVIAGDRARLTQVLTNLLANARTHTPEGTPVTVGLRTEGEGSATRAILTVHDDGPGIDPELQKTLFTRFARGDRSRARQTGGSGLGLSIAKAIVEAHHGTIAVESAPGSTTFTVVLPARPAAA
ncbi:sensor histidine kinase [Microbacterium sp. gxy059]|uniref:sensor histidine kinase n=1 Tax=Microbacterium sp. gxy059 TaxID=2957199 RepID=UPI003D95D040